MRVLLIDDEPPASRALARLVEEALGSSLESLKIFQALEPARMYLADNPIDLLFLDIDLEGESGFDLLVKDVPTAFFTIITSGHTEYALRAFEHSVLDFLPKPVEKARLLSALEKVRRAFEFRGQTRENIPVKKETGVDLVPIQSIEYMVSDRNYVVIALSDGREERVRGTLDHFAGFLPPLFFRVHRSCIVRRESIVRILHGENNTFRVSLKSGVVLPASREAAAELREKK